jgi:hypothetical protein
MVDRVTTVEAAVEAFLTLAEAEGAAVPMYASLCRAIAADPTIASLLLEAPVGQRLPVLVLASLHDLVLDHHDLALAAWFPSAGGEATHRGDLATALRTAVAEHRERLLDRIRTRQVQTNEVNRCVGWRVALAELCADDPRPLTLVEVGASAGLNLAVDRYRVEFHSVGSDAVVGVGPEQSSVRLSTVMRGGDWPRLSAELPPVVERIGLDRSPLDARDPADARWLTACIWPEQAVRLERLGAAIELTADDPPRMVAGDLVEDLAAVVEAAAPDTHLVVLSSWTLAYVDRATRVRFRELHSDLAATRAARGGGLSLATLEAADLLPWVVASPVGSAEPAERRHASLLALTRFDGRGGFDVEPVARCQAHLAWIERP